MDGAAFLLELTRQVRGKTIRVLSAAPEPWLTWAPPGTSNHILWHSGHAVWLQDELCVRRITGLSELPVGWAETFGMNCRAVPTTERWPSAEEVLQQLADQLERLLELIEQLPAESLRLPRPPPSSGWDLVRGVIHGLHDEAAHQGEMYLLFKMCRGGKQGPTIERR